MRLGFGRVFRVAVLFGALGLPASATAIEFGACCLDGGSCIDDTQSGCENDRQGLYLGNGTNCVEDDCPGPTTTMPVFGACCVSGLGCIDDTETGCEVDRGGLYAGDDTNCVANPCPPGTTTSTTVPGPLCGDANADGKVSSVDALVALQVAVGSAVCPLFRCDVNDSTKVSSADALLILRSAVGQMVVLDCPAAV